jgi:replicative DNA helicase
VVSLAQVKAAVDTRPDKRPTAGDLANSDELTREADQILMLYRDEVYARNDGRPVKRGIAEILIEKNRHGPTGFKEFAFLDETMRFADLAKEGF